ncbi:MAG: HAD hydrolase family protein [Candidatus Bathyarchaeia archaeon]
MKKAFISDCEGPISKNDNAYELTAHYVPNGERLFTVISRYDDVLAYVLKRSNYKAGDTLKLILPFLRVYGVTNRVMRDFSVKTLVLISNVRETLNFIRREFYPYIVSTSYEHYIRALCQVLKFPFQNAYCTKLDIDRYTLSLEEKERLRELAAEIAKMPVIEIPPQANSLEDFQESHRKAIRRLDEIFWDEIAKMSVGRAFQEVNPVGGREKAESIESIIKLLGVSLADVVYVGDSITDVEAFKKVREGGGLTVSFNGNEYAVREAEIAIMSNSALVTALVANVFFKLGRETLIELVECWSPSAVKSLPIAEKLKKFIFQVYGGRLPQVEVVRAENMERVMRQSTLFRKSVRGEAIGRLG